MLMVFMRKRVLLMRCVAAPVVAMLIGVALDSAVAISAVVVVVVVAVVFIVVDAIDGIERV